MKKSKKSNGRQPQAAAGKPTAAPRRDPSVDEIRDRAYKLFLQRGGTPGHAIDDWLAAERDLRSGKQ
jgi:hypothetical protein